MIAFLVWWELLPPHLRIRPSFSDPSATCRLGTLLGPTFKIFGECILWTSWGFSCTLAPESLSSLCSFFACAWRLFQRKGRPWLSWAKLQRSRWGCQTLALALWNSHLGSQCLFFCFSTLAIWCQNYFIYPDLPIWDWFWKKLWCLDINWILRRNRKLHRPRDSQKYLQVKRHLRYRLSFFRWVGE